MKKVIRAGILSLTFVLVFTFTAALAEGAVNGIIPPSVNSHAITQGTPIQPRHKNKSNNPIIHVNKHDLTLNKGKSETLKATLLPGGQSVDVTWVSSNPKIAKVSASGKVTAVAPGTTVISATSLEYFGDFDITGYSGMCYITVLGGPSDPKPLTITDQTFNYGKVILIAPTSKYKETIANVKKSIGGNDYYENFPGIGLYEGLMFGSADINKAHTVIYVLSKDKGPIGYGYLASGKSLIMTSRGISTASKKSAVLKSYGQPSFSSQFTRDGKEYESFTYHSRVPGKGIYTQLTFNFLKSKGTITLIAFYLGAQ